MSSFYIPTTKPEDWIPFLAKGYMHWEKGRSARTLAFCWETAKGFPKEEKYSLTDQIRRASRSVCSNLSEGWRKRRYKAVFLNKLTDSGQEAAETQTWLEFSLHCNYIDEETFQRLDDSYEHIFAMLNSMENKADTFCRPSS